MKPKTRKAKKEYSASSIKLLAAIFVLQEEGLSCSKEGAYYFLLGKSDLGEFASLPLFSSHTSLGKMRHSANVNSLIEKGCVKEVSIESGYSPYLLLTEKGEELAKEFLIKKGEARNSTPKPPRYLSLGIVEDAAKKN